MILLTQLGVGSLDNTWIWEPALGPADLRYEVWMQSTDETQPWVEIAIVDMPEVFRTSTQAETYRLKVRAIDRAKNVGPFSEESVWLIIKPFMKPGKPVIKTITVNIDVGK